MPQFLFVVDMPSPGLSSEEIDGPTRWFNFVKKVDAIPLPKGAKKLPCKNVWLFLAEDSEQVRRAMANSADEHQLNHSTFLVSGDVTKI